MLAKVIPNHRSRHDQQSDFSARVAYPCRTAEAVELANLAGTWRDAAFQLRTTAGLAPYMHNPSYHIVLTFDEGEHPSDREIFDAGHSAVEALGGSEHQYILAIHGNRTNIHLHIVCNRVHPITGLVLSTNHDYAKLELACRKIESRNGWPQDRGRFDCRIVDDDVLLVPKPKEHWERKTEARKLGLRPDGRAVRRQEQRNGLPPIRDLLTAEKIGQLRSAIDASNCWQNVHSELGVDGLHYVKHGNGARICRSERSFFVPAGQIGTSCTLNSLEDRLGRFEPAKRPAEKADRVAPVTPTAVAAATDVLPFEAAVQFVKGAVNEIRRWRHDRAAARKALRAAQVIEKQRVRDLLRGRRTPAAQALRKVVDGVHREQRAELRSRYPAPYPMPFDATNAIASLAPAERTYLRYRHAHRSTSMIGRLEPAKVELDHTVCRQSWWLARPRDAANIPEPLANIALRFPDDLRIDRNGNLLFAKRNAAGSIVGFEVRRGEDLYADVRQPTGSGDGLCLLGSQSARRYVVVYNALDGLIRASGMQNEPELIVVAAGNLTPRTEQQLRDLKSGRIEGLERMPVAINRVPVRNMPYEIGDASGNAGNAIGKSTGHGPANDQDPDKSATPNR